MNTYHVKATFSTDRELTDEELLELRRRLLLEITEPVQTTPETEVKNGNLTISRPANWECTVVDLKIGEIYEDD